MSLVIARSPDVTLSEVEGYRDDEAILRYNDKGKYHFSTTF